MKKHQRKVLDVLKTKCRSFGFSRNELKGIAAKIADKLTLEDDATDDEINEAIEEAVGNALPFLEVSQSAADRQVQAYKDAHPVQNDDDDNDDDDDDNNAHQPSSPSKKNKEPKNKETNSEFSEMMKTFTETINGLKSEISELKAGNIAKSRRSKVEALTKDTGKFGERILKSFSRMSFKDDEDFEDYLEDIQSQIDDENQDRANKGLEKLGTPPAVPPATSHEDDKVMSDDEVKSLARGE